MRHLSVLLAAVVLTACGSSGSGGGDSDAGPDKYDQTWTTPYASTTCVHWDNEMDSHQKFVMAADMLLGAWRSDGVDGVLPPDGQVRNFVVAISRACRGLAENVTDMAATIYVLADDMGPP